MYKCCHEFRLNTLRVGELQLEVASDSVEVRRGQQLHHVLLQSLAEAGWRGEDGAGGAWRLAWGATCRRDSDGASCLLVQLLLGH